MVPQFPKQRCFWSSQTAVYPSGEGKDKMKMTTKEQYRDTGMRTSVSATLSITHVMWTGLGSNLDLRADSRCLTQSLHREVPANHSVLQFRSLAKYVIYGQQYGCFYYSCVRRTSKDTEMSKCRWTAIMHSSGTVQRNHSYRQELLRLTLNISCVSVPTVRRCWCTKRLQRWPELLRLTEVSEKLPHRRGEVGHWRLLDDLQNRIWGHGERKCKRHDPGINRQTGSASTAVIRMATSQQ